MPNTAIRVTLAIILLGAGGAVSASADEQYFRTPSKNIYCAYFDYDGPELRCDLQSYTPATDKRPADCDLEWGDAFAIGPNSDLGTMLCHGDTVVSPAARTLGYGKTWTADGISCLSEKRGLTCKNQKGHGFSLSRAKQRMF